MWRSRRCRPFTNTIQHSHCRHTNTQSTGSGHGIRRSPSHLHTQTSAARKYIKPYIHKVFTWTKQNNLTINPDKTTCTLFTPDPAEYKSNLNLKINQTSKGYGPYPRLKTQIQHTHSQHLSTSTQATTNYKHTHSNRMW